MYRSLLYSAGGGIVSPEQQAEQACCANIFIGLGGTGIDCLKQVKKQVYEQIRPDDPNAGIPSYQHIKFLALDADPLSLGDTNLPSSLNCYTEFLDLRHFFAGGPPGLHLLLKNPAFQWLKVTAMEPDGIGIQLPLPETGAGGIRQTGRLLLFLKIPQFLDKLTTLIIQARAGLPTDTETYIHIFTGLGGGMGSGAFLDVCYLIQYVANMLGFSSSVHTLGYFFMPEVNLSRILDLGIQAFVRSNGFAAMQELDYCMDFKANGGSWEQDYGNGVEIHTTNPPVNLAYLISAADTAGVVRTDAYQYAIHTVADSVMESLIRPNVTTFPLAPSLLANAVAFGHMVTKNHGACYNYCTLGAASAYIPYKEITTYFSAKMFEGFNRLNYQLPTEPELEAFMQACGLRYKDILKSIHYHVPDIPLYEVDSKMLYHQTAGITPDIIPQVLRQMLDSIFRIQGQMEVNQKALLAAMPYSDEENGKGISSMIGRVRKQLMLLAADPDKGPYFTAAILHSTHSKDLSYRIDGLIMENRQYLEMAMNDMTLRKNNMANALRELQNSNIFYRKIRAEQYVQAVNKYVCQMAKIHLFEIAGKTLDQFKHQIPELYTQFFGIFERVFRELQSTFAENLSALSHPAAQNNDYAMKLLTIQELQPSLDESVEAMNSNELISGFVTYLLERPDLWLNEDENKISRGVSNYFLDRFKDFTNRTMRDCLRIKFNTSDPNTLTRKTLNEILMPLAQKAEPLFWTNHALYNFAESGKLGYCSIPKESHEIEYAALDYHTADPTVSIRSSYTFDRIRFQTLRCGIPMFAYKGTDAYRNDAMIPGTHLYEGTTRDPRDWRKLFDITPYSCRSDLLITDELRHRADLVEEATRMGIREEKNRFRSCQYAIHLYDENSVQDLADLIQKILDAEDVEQAKQLLSEMIAHPLEPVDQIVMKTPTDRTWADTVNRDLIIASEEMFNLVSRQVETANRYQECRERLSDFIRNATQENRDIYLFTYALCAGTIKRKNNYSFIYTTVLSFGIVEENELTNFDTQPYGELLPLYSAYVNFAQLNEETKQLIHDCARDSWINDPEKTAASLKALTAWADSDQTRDMEVTIRHAFSDEEQKIMQFLDKFIGEINCFSIFK